MRQTKNSPTLFKIPKSAMFFKTKQAETKISLNRKNCQHCAFWSRRQTEVGNCWLNDQPFQTKCYQVCQHFRKRYHLPDSEEFN